MSRGALPLPPVELASYVGAVSADDPMGSYEAIGRRIHDEIVGLLPSGWSFEGKRVLDFGCGSGRVLRHFVEESEQGEFWGCDIDDASVSWAEDNLSPPLRFFGNEEQPPLPQPDGSFDLIWAISVFTHLSDTWSAWLVDLHRLLADGGLLIATFMGEGMSEFIAGEPWREEVIGMNVLGYGESWSNGGPMVLHSPWWIEAHWGRGFEILELRSKRFATGPEEGDIGHGVVLMRKKRVNLTVEMIEAPERDDPRELLALGHGLDQLHREIAKLRESHNAYAAAYQEERDRRADAERELAKTRSASGWRGAAGAWRAIASSVQRRTGRIRGNRD